MAPTLDILRAMSETSDAYSFEFSSLPAGAAHYAATGEAFPDTSLQGARAADAILLSAMGLPDVRYPDGTEISPQIDLRKKLGLFAGVRPVRIRNPAVSPLKIPDEQLIDFVLIRESTEGLFHSQGKGEVEENEARETLRITRDISENLFEFAFNLARRRKAQGKGSGRVTCVDKANVFRAFAFFREIFNARAQNYPDLTADHAYVDAMALWMVQKPWEFDVLVTENMFGDILSDLGAGLMGGLGLAPSADVGLKHAVFQPCHGSAPDIAGQGIANPLAMFLSAAMMLDWLGETRQNPAMQRDAERLEDAVDDLVRRGDCPTRDLGGTSSTNDVADGVISALRTA